MKFSHVFQEEHKRIVKIQEWRACCYVQPMKRRHLNQEQSWATIVHTSSFWEDQENWFVMEMALGQLLYRNVLVRRQDNVLNFSEDNNKLVLNWCWKRPKIIISICKNILMARPIYNYTDSCSWTFQSLNNFKESYIRRNFWFRVCLKMSCRLDSALFWLKVILLLLEVSDLLHVFAVCDRDGCTV
jgi:hypothetical protein